MKTKIELLELLLKELQTGELTLYGGLCNLKYRICNITQDERMVLHDYIRKNQPGLFTVLKLSNMWHYLTKNNDSFYYTPGVAKPRINYLKYLIKKEHAKQRRN